MNLFDVIPFLGRRVLDALVIALFMGLLILPGPTRRFIQGQFNDLRAQITHELTHLVPTQFSTRRAHTTPCRRYASRIAPASTTEDLPGTLIGVATL